MNQKIDYKSVTNNLWQLAENPFNNAREERIMKDAVCAIFDLQNQLSAGGGLTPCQLLEQQDALAGALKRIEELDHRMAGDDWEKVIEARDIARAALALVKVEDK